MFAVPSDLMKMYRVRGGLAFWIRSKSNIKPLGYNHPHSIWKKQAKPWFVFGTLEKGKPNIQECSETYVKPRTLVVFTFG